MKISEDERLAIRNVITAGKRFGYGNLMGHLATAWARALMDEYDMSEDTARQATFGVKGYPFAMQADLIERGEWDETGKRYRKEKTT